MVFLSVKELSPPNKIFGNNEIVDFLRVVCFQVPNNHIHFFFLEIGEKGFPLPVVDGVQLVNPEVTPGQVKNFFRFCKICY